MLEPGSPQKKKFNIQCYDFETRKKSFKLVTKENALFNLNTKVYYLIVRFYHLRKEKTLSGCLLVYTECVKVVASTKLHEILKTAIKLFYLHVIMNPPS